MTIARSQSIYGGPDPPSTPTSWASSTCCYISSAKADAITHGLKIPKTCGRPKDHVTPAWQRYVHQTHEAVETKRHFFVACVSGIGTNLPVSAIPSAAGDNPS